jgi:hypothetical protein
MSTGSEFRASFHNKKLRKEGIKLGSREEEDEGTIWIMVVPGVLGRESGKCMEKQRTYHGARVSRDRCLP